MTPSHHWFLYNYSSEIRHSQMGESMQNLLALLRARTLGEFTGALAGHDTLATVAAAEHQVGADGVGGERALAVGLLDGVSGVAAARRGGVIDLLGDQGRALVGHAAAAVLLEADGVRVALVAEASLGVHEAVRAAAGALLPGGVVGLEKGARLDAGILALLELVCGEDDLRGLVRLDVHAQAGHGAHGHRVASGLLEVLRVLAEGVNERAALLRHGALIG